MRVVAPVKLILNRPLPWILIHNLHFPRQPAPAWITPELSDTRVFIHDARYRHHEKDYHSQAAFPFDLLGALINTELMVKLGRSGYGVAEVGVNHFPRVGGEQTGAKLSVIWLAFRELKRMHRTLKHIDMAERHYARRRALRSNRML